MNGLKLIPISFAKFVAVFCLAGFLSRPNLVFAPPSPAPNPHAPKEDCFVDFVRELREKFRQQEADSAGIAVRESGVHQLPAESVPAGDSAVVPLVPGLGSAKTNPAPPILSVVAKPNDHLKTSSLVSELKNKGYTDIAFIGAGGMGRVFSAEKDGVHYVFKESLPGKNLDAIEAENYFAEKIEVIRRRELDAAKKLGRAPPPDYFPQAVSWHKARGQVPAYLQMKFFPKSSVEGTADYYVRAPSLFDRMQSGQLTPRMEEQVILAVTEAIFQLNQNKIVHYDIKPENILVNDQGQVKIIDFGLSADRGGSVRLVTRPGFAVGTPLYMSPRQLRMKTPESSDDVYALGTTLMEMLAKRELRSNGNLRGVPPNGYQVPFIHLRFDDPPLMVRYCAPPRLANRALAVAIYHFQNRNIAQYREAISNAIEMSEPDFMKAFGKDLKDELAQKINPDQKSSVAADAVARTLLSSPVLLNYYPKGLGFTAAEQQKIQAAVERLRKEAKPYFDDDGIAINKPVSIFDENPYLEFKDFDRLNPAPPPKPPWFKLPSWLGGKK